MSYNLAIEKQTVLTAIVSFDKVENLFIIYDGGHFSMKKQTASTPVVTSDKKTARFTHYSDGSELIPSEVAPESQTTPNVQPLKSGYTIDDEGIMNTYAREPKMSASTYPTPQQQSRYILWGVAAVIFVSIILGIAVAVS
jgi:hypothetical protein